MPSTDATAPAIIFVDGKEFIRCEEGDDYRRLFDETVREVGGEVALMVWKPRHDIYLRERLSMTSRTPSAGTEFRETRKAVASLQ